jgi:hypothetical protein
MKPARFALVASMCALFGLAIARAADKAPAVMATAANRLLESLSPEQKAKATFPFDADERMRWHYIPTGATAPGFPRYGLTLREMNSSQRLFARELLRTGMSARGFMTVTSIMDLEDVLGAIEEAEGRAVGRAPTFRRDPLGYFFSVFGTPAATGTWGWRVDGHHVSLHFTIVKGDITVSTPTFFGTNPAEVREGPKAGVRILADQEDSARALMLHLTEAQRAKAMIAAAAPGDILTTNRYPIDPLTPAGLPSGELTAPQRDQLLRLVGLYTSAMTEEIAAKRVGANPWRGGVSAYGLRRFRLPSGFLRAGRSNCVKDSVLPSGSVNHATRAPLGEDQIPRSSCPIPSYR